MTTRLPFRRAALRLVHPLPKIILVSDIHLPSPGSEVVALYEMLDHILPRSGGTHLKTLIVRGGDQVDGEALAHKNDPFSLLMLCVNDVLNWESEADVAVLDLDGNHNERQTLPNVIESAAQAGLQNIPGLFIRMPQRDGAYVHSHQFDSEKILAILSKTAASYYDDLVANSPESAAFCKKLTKHFMAAIGYEDSYLCAASIYNADILFTSHTHLPTDDFVYNEQKSRFMAFKRFLKHTGMTGALMGLQHLAPLVSRAVNAPRANKILHDFLASHKDKTVSQNILKLAELMRVDPEISLLKNLHFKDLKPRHYGYAPPAVLGGVQLCNTGAFTDGLRTYVEINAQGAHRLINWMEERVHYGLNGPFMSEEKLIQRHFDRYGGFHPHTIPQLQYYLDPVNGLKGTLDGYESAARGVLPERDALWDVQISPYGLRVTPPAHALAAAKANPVLLSPEDIAPLLNSIDQRILEKYGGKIPWAAPFKPFMPHKEVRELARAA